MTDLPCETLNPVSGASNTTARGGRQITYTCDTGYRHTAGDLVRNCSTNGTWDGTAPTCQSTYNDKTVVLTAHGIELLQHAKVRTGIKPNVKKKCEQL